MKFQFMAALLFAIIVLPATSATFSSPSLAQTIRSSTSQGLKVLEKGYLPLNGHQTYEFRGDGNQTATIALNSREFDTYLELYDINGRLLDRSDDVDGNTNSRIRLTLPSTGIYTVVVRGKYAAQRGRFALQISTEQSQPTSLPSRRPQTQATGTVQAGQSRFHMLTGQAGETVIISLNSTQFDPYLTIQNATGQVIAENDDAQNTNSRIALRLPSTGIYTAEVRGFNTDAQGEYTLTIDP